MTSNNRLSIIIPVLHIKRPLNKKRFFMPRQTIVDLLAEIRANVHIAHEVIVVCNGDNDELRKFVCTSPNIHRYCLNSANVGVARAWNMGAQIADGNILCYINDDVSIGSGALEALVNQLLSDTSIGQIGPAGSYWHQCKHSRFVDGEKPTDADVVSGFCFLMRTETFYKLGGFDIEFTPAGYEEIDFSFRVRQAGMRCVVDPGSAIKHFHHHGISAQRTDIHYMGKVIDTESLHERNSAYFRKKWQGVFP